MMSTTEDVSKIERPRRRPLALTEERLLADLTPIDKVRRNVILLAALSCLAAFFTIDTGQISFLGARLTSDVLYFGLFHALAFYTLVLVTRAMLSVVLPIDALLGASVTNTITTHHLTTSPSDPNKVLLDGLRDIVDRIDERSSKQQEPPPPPPRSLWLYVMFGEYVFAIVFGFVACVLLWWSQQFPMIWELALPRAAEGRLPL